MLRVFRKIRINSIRTSRFAKYFIYGIGEIVLVVIGILLALQINSWNQQNKDRKAEKELLLSIKQDLEADLEDIQFTISETNNKVFDLNNLAMGLGDRTISKDEFVGYNTSFPAFYKVNYNTSSYNEAVSTGKLSIILNKTLKHELLRYYTNTQTFGDVYTENLMINDLFSKWTEILSPTKEYGQAIGIANNNFMPLDMNAMFENTDLIGIYNTKNALMSTQIVGWEEQLEKIRSILNQINFEIESRWN